MKDIRKWTGRMGNQMFEFAYLYSQVREGNIPDWYLQDPKYFEKYSHELREIFGEGIGSIPRVGIHIRIGKNPIDPSEPAYMDNQFYVNLLRTDYYQSALKKFPGEDFLVFSDEPETANRFMNIVLPAGQFKMVPKGDEIEDFNLLASCKSFIIANSSWSWWAAFLGKDPQKHVIAPSDIHWYSDGQQRTHCPQEWTRL